MVVDVGLFADVVEIASGANQLTIPECGAYVSQTDKIVRKEHVFFFQNNSNSAKYAASSREWPLLWKKGK